MDLSTYTTTQLRALNSQVEQQITDRNKSEIAQARENIAAIAKSIGLPLNELMGGFTGKMTKVKAPVPALYRNPNNTSQQWSGRGRKPLWVNDHLNDGGSLDDLLIAKAAS